MRGARPWEEKLKPKRKKKKLKVDRTTNIVSLDSDDVQIMTEAIIKVAHTSFKSIEEWQEEILGTVTNLLKVLCKAVEEVKIIVACPSGTTESQAPSKT